MKLSGQDQENSFSEREKGKDRSRSEEEFRSDGVEYGDEILIQEFIDYGVENVMFKMFLRSEFRIFVSVFEY